MATQKMFVAAEFVFAAAFFAGIQFSDAIEESEFGTVREK